MSYRLDQGVEVCPHRLGDAQADRAIKTKLNCDVTYKTPITKGARNINISLQTCLYSANNQGASTTSFILKGLKYQNCVHTVFEKKLLGPSKDFISIHKIYKSSNFSVYEDN